MCKKKSKKECPDGKVLNPETGRCVTLKTKKEKNCSEEKCVVLKAKKEKECPEGKVLNPETGRCVILKTKKEKKCSEEKCIVPKAKKEKECPEGKVLNPKTGRCVTLKTKKEKNCSEGQVINPETEKCIYPKTLQKTQKQNVPKPFPIKQRSISNVFSSSSSYVRNSSSPYVKSSSQNSSVLSRNSESSKLIIPKPDISIVPVEQEPVVAKIKNPNILKKMEKFRNYGDLNNVLNWVGINNFGLLHMIYLIKKYGSDCLGVGENKFDQGKYSGINIFKSEDEIEKNMDDMNDKAKQISKCISQKNTKIIIIPVVIFNKHANLLVYKRTLNTIEHIEPHGGFHLGVKISDIDKINEQIEYFVNAINSNLPLNRFPIRFVNSYQSCPMLGFQYYDGLIKKKETEGYCLAWSLFVAELALSNPDIPHSQLMEIFFNDPRFSTNQEELSKYLLSVIRGYVRNIYDKVFKYYNIFGITPENIISKKKNFENSMVQIIIKLELANINGENINDIINEIIENIEESGIELLPKIKLYFKDLIMLFKNFEQEFKNKFDLDNLLKKSLENFLLVYNNPQINIRDKIEYCEQYYIRLTNALNSHFKKFYDDDFPDKHKHDNNIKQIMKEHKQLKKCEYLPIYFDENMANKIRNIKNMLENVRTHFNEMSSSSSSTTSK